MWLKIAHFVGLTNLSNTQVRRYEELHHEGAETEQFLNTFATLARVVATPGTLLIMASYYFFIVLATKEQKLLFIDISFLGRNIESIHHYIFVGSFLTLFVILTVAGWHNERRIKNRIKNLEEELGKLSVWKSAYLEATGKEKISQKN